MNAFKLAPLPAALLCAGLSTFGSQVAAQTTPATASTPTPQTVDVRGQREPYVMPATRSATRTDTPVEQVPQSIVSLPRALIEDQGAQTLSQVLRNASNVNQIDPRDANNVVFKIRGFHAATVVDGVAMPGYFAGQESLAMVEQVDVLKGPAGALFGASQSMGSYGNLGGTIAITTREADASAASRELGLHLGSFASKGLNFDVNQPLSPSLALRLGGEHARSDSETTGVFFRRTALNPSLSWQPNAATRVVLRLRYLENNTLDYSGLPLQGTLDRSNFTLARSTNIASEGQPDTTQRAHGINLQWTQQLTDVWSWSLIAAHNTAEVDQRGVWLVDATNAYGCMAFGSATASGNLMCGARMWDRFETNTFSPSLSAQFNTGEARHKVTLGIDVEKTRDDGFMLYSNVLGPVSMTPVDLPSASYPAWSEPVAPAVPDQQNRYSARVFYAQDQLDVGAWHLLASLRHSDLKITDVNPAWMVNNVSHSNHLTPRLGAVLDITPQVSAFAGYGEGVKVPTSSIFSTPPKPESSEQRELGLKLKRLGGLSATVAYFDLRRRNAVVADAANPGYSTQSGLQRSHGVDLDARWQASPSLAWLFNLTQMQARTEQDSNAAHVGKVLFNTPERSARLAARYDALSGTLAGWGAGLGLSYHGKLAGDTSNSYFTPTATVWDAQLSYKTGGTRYSLSVNNLLDKQYFMPSAYFSGGQVTPAAPRTVQASAQLAF
jgi:iron complex outermembrane receptor protein